MDAGTRTLAVVLAMADFNQNRDKPQSEIRRGQWNEGRRFCVDDGSRDPQPARVAPKPRFDYPGANCHEMSRGDRWDNLDCRSVIQTLGEAFSKTDPSSNRDNTSR